LKLKINCQYTTVKKKNVNLGVMEVDESQSPDGFGVALETVPVLQILDPGDLAATQVAFYAFLAEDIMAPI
jgi:hypothetical protein